MVQVGAEVYDIKYRRYVKCLVYVINPSFTFIDWRKTSSFISGDFRKDHA